MALFNTKSYLIIHRDKSFILRRKIPSKAITRIWRMSLSTKEVLLFTIKGTKVRDHVFKFVVWPSHWPFTTKKAFMQYTRQKSNPIVSSRLWPGCVQPGTHLTSHKPLLCVPIWQDEKYFAYLWFCLQQKICLGKEFQYVKCRSIQTLTSEVMFQVRESIESTSYDLSWIPAAEIFFCAGFFLIYFIEELVHCACDTKVHSNDVATIQVHKWVVWLSYFVALQCTHVSDKLNLLILGSVRF